MNEQLVLAHEQECPLADPDTVQMSIGLTFYKPPQSTSFSFLAGKPKSGK
jgi:hypothetical protein